MLNKPEPLSEFVISYLILAVDPEGNAPFTVAPSGTPNAPAELSIIVPTDNVSITKDDTSVPPVKNVVVLPEVINA